MNLNNEINSLLKKALGVCGYDCEVNSVFSARPELCDYQSNFCFALAKSLKKNPLQLAEEVVNAIPKNTKFAFTAEKPGFINIKIKSKYLEKKANELLLDKLVGVEKNKKPKKIILDYGGANVAKELHVGHLRSPLIGESLKRLHNLFGDETISDAHLGDWGLQMGLTLLQLKEDGYLDYYFDKKCKEIPITLEMLNEAYPKASARKAIDEEFRKRAEETTLAIQQKKEPYFTIYKKIRQVSVEQIAKNYSDLNATFDYFYGESDAQPYIDRAVQTFIDKGLARESEGALVVDVAREGEHIPIPRASAFEVQRYERPMPPVIIKKHNGADVYATTDIATILMRNEMFEKVNEIIYIVDGRQDSHFERVFRACKLSGISPEGQKLTHVGFGTMNGKDGKPFKTREGTTVKLADIVNLLIDKSSEKIRSNGLKPSRQLALKIGVAGMKFGDLSNNVAKDYVFDIDKFLSFEGKTGPYLQYTVARINSILAKNKEDIGKIKIYNEEQRKIMIALLKLISAYKICYDEYSLNTLCSSSFDLASAFSSFYNNCPILSEKNAEKRNSFLATCQLVRKALSQALYVLAIDVVEKM